MAIALPSSDPKLQQLIYVKTNIAGWFFDAWIRMDHTSKLKITENPVQTGAAISDHSYLEPAELTIEIGMSDSATSIVDGQFSDGWSRSSSAYKVLKELQSLRVPLQILTRLGVYKNMVIESISAPDDYKTLNGLRVSVILREIIIAQVQTVKLSARSNATGNTNKGNQEPVDPNKSILKQLDGLLFGN